MTAANRRVAAALIVTTLVASPVQAVIPDPVEAGLLAKISAALQAIEEFRMRVMVGLERQVSARVNNYAFPNRLFAPIRVTVATVLDTRREIQRLACPWPLSARAGSLRELLQKRGELCRAGYQNVWGSHEAMWDGPLQETNDYVATMTANMLSDRAEKTSTSWTRAHKELFDEHTILRSSPGEANRAEAAALGWANEVAVGNSQVATQHLLVRQMNRDLERFDQKKAADLTYYTFLGLTTLSGGTWSGAPPDPGDGTSR